MPARILVAEDDDLQGAVLRAALEHEGYQAEVVTDGLEAVRRLRLGCYDLALIDYHMPVVNGLAAATLLQDFVGVEGRPRLIAITAAAEGLCERQDAAGIRAFDAVISKQLGLPALMTAIVANLKLAAEAKTVRQTITESMTERGYAAMRRRRWRSPVAAIPALAMVAAFLAAFGWASTSLRQVDIVATAARQTELLGGNATSLQTAVQKAETSQKAYLATGAADDRLAFDTDIRSVDRMLISSATLNIEGLPGFGADAAARTSIERRLEVLSEEAQSKPEVGGEAALVGQTASSEDILANTLRLWASKLTHDSQQVMLDVLLAARQNVTLVLVVLGAGVVYGLWNAVWAVLRCWRSADPGMTGPRRHTRTIEHGLDATPDAVFLRSATGTSYIGQNVPETAT